MLALRSERCVVHDTNSTMIVEFHVMEDKQFESTFGHELLLLHVISVPYQQSTTLLIKSGVGHVSVTVASPRLFLAQRCVR